MPHSNFPFALRVFSSVCKGSLSCLLGFKDLSCSEHYMLQMIVISEWLCKSTMTLFDVLHADFLQEKKRKPKENKEKNPYQTSNFNRGSVRYIWWISTLMILIPLRAIKVQSWKNYADSNFHLETSCWKKGQILPQFLLHACLFVLSSCQDLFFHCNCIVISWKFKLAFFTEVSFYMNAVENLVIRKALNEYLLKPKDSMLKKWTIRANYIV